MLDKIVQRNEYLESTAGSWEDAKIAVLGVPLDGTSTYRPGARFAPGEIRRVFHSLETYSVNQKADLSGVSYFDMGDVLIPWGNTARGLENTRAVVEEIALKGKIPVLIGGEHIITAASVGALFPLYPGLVVLHFDAHADLRSDYLGETLSHASVIFRLLEYGVKDIYQFGIRSGSMEEFRLSRHKTCLFTDKVLKPLEKISPRLGRCPVYVTLDIDIVDPGFAPGTGTPEPGGISPRRLFEIFLYLKELNVVGFDLVEVSPPYDHSQITSILAAKILREALIALRS